MTGPARAVGAAATRDPAELGTDDLRMDESTTASDGGITGTFRSILFGSREAPSAVDEIAAPRCFTDLNLDQVVTSVISPKQPYQLRGYFHAPLEDPDEVRYRQEIFRDLETQPIYELISEFANGMLTTRERLARMEKATYHYQKLRWFLDAATSYCEAVEAIAHNLTAAQPQSRGLNEVGRCLDRYLRSRVFTDLRDEADNVARGLKAITYNVWVHGAKLSIGAYDDEPDYSVEVTKTFERFQQQPVEAMKDRSDRPERGLQRSGRRPRPGSSSDEFMNHVEAQILEAVAKVFPDRFAALDAFRRRHDEFLDQTVTTFDREVQFYVAYLDYVGPLRQAGLQLSYPRMSASSKAENAADTFDLALAAQLLREGDDGNSVVCNDIQLTGAERILVVSGPNNGGKTTMARTVGQLHYLARLGCPVPGREVRLFLVDEIYTHFEKEEDITTLAGKLQDELNRLHADFQRATPRSLIIMNEMFGSTTVHDAVFLSKQMLSRVSDLDALGVCVTFLDELATLDEKTVSMVSTVDPNDLARRTFKVIRTQADGRAYARALAEKYGLTYETLKERLGS